MPKCDLKSNFTEITLRHGCSPVNLLYIFRIPFLKNTSGWLLLRHSKSISFSLNHFSLTHTSISTNMFFKSQISFRKKKETKKSSRKAFQGIFLKTGTY